MAQKIIANAADGQVAAVDAVIVFTTCGSVARRAAKPGLTTRCSYLETVKPSSAYWAAKTLTGTAVAERLLGEVLPTVSNRDTQQDQRDRFEALAGLALLTLGDAQSMRQDEWKSLLLMEWDRWIKTQPVEPPTPTARDTLKFFCELQDKRSPLLDFRPNRRDKWQIIHARLLNEGRVSD